MASPGRVLTQLLFERRAMCSCKGLRLAPGGEPVREDFTQRVCFKVVKQRRGKTEANLVQIWIVRAVEQSFRRQPSRSSQSTHLIALEAQAIDYTRTAIPHTSCRTRQGLRRRCQVPLLLSRPCHTSCICRIQLKKNQQQ